jgi:predicted oxidoreductase
MNKLTPDYPLDLEHVRSQIAARDGALDNAVSENAQIMAIQAALQDKMYDRTTRRRSPPCNQTGDLLSSRDATCAGHGAF